MPVFFPQRACFSGAQVQENEYCDGKNCVLIWNPTRHDAPMQVLIHWEDWHLPLPPKNCVQIRGIGQQTQKQQLRELCSRFLAGLERYPNNSHIGWRPRMASKTVKLQRPARATVCSHSSSLRTWPPAISALCRRYKTGTPAQIGKSTYSVQPAP